MYVTECFGMQHIIILNNYCKHYTDNVSLGAYWIIYKRLLSNYYVAQQVLMPCAKNMVLPRQWGACNRDKDNSSADMDPYVALQLTTPVANKCMIVTQCVGQRDAKVKRISNILRVFTRLLPFSIFISFFLISCPTCLVLTVLQAGALDNNSRSSCTSSWRLF